MKKRGFTLIELLAVIVVLAIIALIATPIVMNVIKKANAGAAERSADNYVKAVETLIATEKLDGTPVADGTYTIGTDGNLDFGDVEVSGTKPVGGKLTITNGQVDKSKTEITYSDYTVKFPNGKAETSEKGDALVLCKAAEPVEQWVWDDPSFSSKKEIVGIKATESNPYVQSGTYKCNLGDGDRIFYVLKSTKDTVSLIMEENVGYSPLCKNEIDNVCDGADAIEYLNSQTTEWTKLFSANGKVELPLREDVLDGYNPTWLRANLNDNEGPCYYWLLDDNYAVAMSFGGGLAYGSASDNYGGVRPVITISKDNMSL